MARTTLLALTMLVLAMAWISGCGGRSEQDLSIGEEIAKQRLVEQGRQELQPVVVEGQDGPARTLAELPFDLSWDLPLDAPVHASWLSENVPELLMVQLITGEVLGINVYTGMTQWQSQPLPKPISLRPYVQRVVDLDPATGEEIIDDRLYIISGDELYVIDCAYGQLIWRHHLGQNGIYGFQPSTGPYAIGTGENLRVFIGDWAGRVRVISRHLGFDRSYHAWQWNLRAVPTAQPDGAEGLVYVGDRSGTMRCFPQERKLLWQYDALAAIRGTPFVRGYNIYFGGQDGVLHVLNRLSGRVMAKLFLGAELSRQPFAFDDEPQSLYVWASNHGEMAGLHKIHTTDDRIRIEDVPDKAPLEVNRVARDWFLPNVNTLVASSPGKLYVTRANSTVILCVDRNNGEIEWHWDLASDDHGTPDITHLNVHQDPSDNVRSIITANSEGMLRVYRLFGHQ